MFITSHALASIVISQHVPQPHMAFLLSLFSHYLLDMIPHGDEQLGHWTKKEIPISRFFFTVTIDIAILSVIIITFFLNARLPNPPVFFASVIGGVLPDAMYILHEFFSKYLNTIFKKIQRYAHFLPPSLLLRYQERFHYFIHRIIPLQISMKKGIVLQLAFILLLIIAII